MQYKYNLNDQVRRLSHSWQRLSVKWRCRNDPSLGH